MSLFMVLNGLFQIKCPLPTQEVEIPHFYLTKQKNWIKTFLAKKKKKKTILFSLGFSEKKNPHVHQKSKLFPMKMSPQSGFYEEKNYWR